MNNLRRIESMVNKTYKDAAVSVDINELNAGNSARVLNS